MRERVIYGIHSVRAVLEKNPENVIELLIVSQRDDVRIKDIIQLAEKLDIRKRVVERKKLDREFADFNHQGVVARVIIRNYSERELAGLLDAISGEPLLLILDGVQDPHNLGACLRSANAAGVHAVIAPKDGSVGLTPVVCKVASGAVEVTPFIQVTNLVCTMKMLQERGIWLYGADGEAKQSIYNSKLTGSIALVVGAEGKGLRRLTRESCDFLVKIPMQGTVASLNVSVATAISLFEIARQRTL